MFDIGFWELVLISVVGLVVLGPERLPHAIRSVSKFIGAAKNMANSVKDELSHELKVQELQDNLRKAEQMGMEDLSPELRSSVEQLKQAAQDVQRPYANKSDTPTNSAEEANETVESTSNANDSVGAVESINTQSAPQADKKAE
ncbi:Sec-independent protein translocase protein TatB [Vibrio sinaloensis]|uniref:Sec-independent protein translocase protein TatB n=1 Tax=Photobacterium sp. (strain ATCC 43367) TaxID=379097 RepID=UPI00204DD381|nr:Sec-independent protein translocase protein TatB [Vibrio sinaloensis]UPQ87932.1 Sec-independent protein translocase protein TatB [Vibrio sinaloensis]